MANEKSHGRRNETDTIIARMEAQFHEEKTPIADSHQEAKNLWGERLAHSGPEVNLAFILNANMEAVGMADPLPVWGLLQTKTEAGQRRPSAVHRWLLTRARERSREGGIPSDQSTAEQRFIDTWSSRVDESRRERFVLDLEYVVKRVKLIFAGKQGLIWLESFNYDLNARPIDVLQERGPAEVITALDGEEQGAL